MKTILIIFSKYLAIVFMASAASCKSGTLAFHNNDTQHEDADTFEDAFFFSPKDARCIELLYEILDTKSIDWTAEGSVIYFGSVEKGKKQAAIAALSADGRLFVYAPDSQDISKPEVLVLVSSRSDLEFEKLRPPSGRGASGVSPYIRTK